MTIAESRSSVVDLCRGIAMLLVIYGHALEVMFVGRNSAPEIGFSQWQFIYSFHMAPFFFLSGVVHRRKELSLVVKASFSLIVLALLTHLLGSALRPELTWREIVRPFYTLQYFSLAVTWYLVTHAGLILIAQLFTRSGRVGRLGVALILLAIFVASQLYDRKLFQLHTLPVGALLFGAGVLAQKGWPLVRHRAPHGVLLAGVVALLLLTAVVIAPMNGGCSFSYVQHCLNHESGFVVLFLAASYGYLPLFLASSLVGLLMCVGLAELLDKGAIGRGRDLLRWIGQNTITLLIVNGVFLSVVQPHLAGVVDVASAVHHMVVWPVGLAVVQLLLAPFAKPFVARLVSLSDWLAEKCVSRMSKLRMLGAAQ